MRGPFFTGALLLPPEALLLALAAASFLDTRAGDGCGRDGSCSGHQEECENEEEAPFAMYHRWHSWSTVLGGARVVGDVG